MLTVEAKAGKAEGLMAVWTRCARSMHIHAVTLGVLLLAFHLPINPAWGQTVDVQVRDIASNRLLAGAIVGIDSVLSSRTTSAITNEDGRAILRVRPGDQYVLSVRRIGYVPVRKSITTDGTGHSVVQVGMTANPHTLETVDIRVKSTCASLLTEATNVSRLWQDIKIALEANVLTDAESNHSMEIEKYERDLDRRQREQRKTAEMISRFTNQPFTAASGKELEEDGYVRKKNGADYYYSPDARTLLSDDFAKSHCFFPDMGARSRNVVGLRFNPKSDISSPNIKGVLWIDARNSDLRTLDYEYVNLRLPVPVPGVGGRVEFEQLPSGEWFINRWFIRTPRIGRITGSGIGWNAQLAVDTLIGFHEVGAVVRSISRYRPNNLAVLAEKPVYTLTGRVLNDASGLPVIGAEIAAGNTKVHSDSLGGFKVVVPTHDPLLINIRKPGFFAANFRAVFSKNSAQSIEIRLRPIIPVFDTIKVR